MHTLSTALKKTAFKFKTTKKLQKPENKATINCQLITIKCKQCLMFLGQTFPVTAYQIPVPQTTLDILGQYICVP